MRFVSLESHLLVVASSSVHPTWPTMAFRSPMENVLVNWYMDRVWLLNWHGYMFLHGYRHRLLYGYRYDLLHRVRHLFFDRDRDGLHDRYGHRLGDWHVNRIGLRNRYSHRVRHGDRHGLRHWDTCIFFCRKRPRLIIKPFIGMIITWDINDNNIYR